MTVYNALPFLQQSLESFEQHTPTKGVSVILVNDGSTLVTSNWLAEYTKQKNTHYLVEFSENRGYTKAVNFGIRVSTGEYLIIMNSDILLPKGWVQGMMKCMCKDQSIGMVGPLSNAGGFQNVPGLFRSNGDFATNNMPNGMSFEGTAEAISKSWEGSCIPVLMLNGFFYMLRRAVLDLVGYLDQSNFPQGFGEEEDYSLRVRAAGFSLVVVDNVYVYHFKSKSFEFEERVALLKQGRLANKAKHSREIFMSSLWNMSELASLQNLRSRVCRDVYKNTGC